LECRQVFLYAIKKAQDKYRFKLYALCIMSNHVHYLMEPTRSEDLPKIMHWLNWYTAMCFNRMLNRTGHFWEKRYHSTGFANIHILHLAVETASTQTKPAYAGSETLDFSLVRAGGLGLYSPRIPF
jgi:putative transposase